MVRLQYCIRTHHQVITVLLLYRLSYLRPRLSSVCKDKTIISNQQEIKEKKWSSQPTPEYWVIFQLSITFRFNPFNIRPLYKVILSKHLSLPSRIVKQLVLLSEKASFTMIKAILIDTKQVVLLFKMISLLSKMLILYKVQTLQKLNNRGRWDYQVPRFIL